MPYKDKEFHKEYRKQRSAAMTEWLQEYKRLRSCVDCGYNKDPAGLEFDHLRDKRFNVGQGAHYSMKIMLEEIEKCELVCGTCHNIRTYNRRINQTKGL
jgi:hypothetical protein